MVAILSSLSPPQPHAAPDPIASDPKASHDDSTAVSPHDLSMFLLAQLFSREANRTDAANESWPGTSNPPNPFTPGGGAFFTSMDALSSPHASFELLSPTRRDSANPSFLNSSPRLSSSSTPGAKTLLR